MNPMQAYHQWVNKHGGESSSVLHGNWYLYPTGARRSNAAYVNSAMYEEPPTDPVELLKAKLTYCELKLADEQAQYDTFEAGCLRQNDIASSQFYSGNASRTPTAGEREIAQLEAGHKRITALREQLTALQEEWAITGKGSFRQSLYDVTVAKQREIQEQTRKLQAARGGFAFR